MELIQEPAKLYVTRNDQGRIQAIFSEPQYDGMEALPPFDMEIIRFFAGSQAYLEALSALSQTDLMFIRVLEDLVGTLITKNVIMITDLPSGAIDKLMERKNIRLKLENLKPD